MRDGTAPQNGADAANAPQGRGGEGRRGGGFGGGGNGGGGFGGGRDDAPGQDGGGQGMAWQRPPDGADSGGIPLDDELIEAIAEEAAANGMPMEPERFKQMLRGRDGEGTPRISPRMIERMSSMGIDIQAIAERLGKTIEEPEEPPIAAPPVTAMSVEMDSEYLEKRAGIDFSKYANPQSLEDGEAKQELNRLQDEFLVATENLKLAETELDATRRLVEREFETQNNLDKQRVSVQTNTIKVESAKVARELYIKYEFPKQVETLLSNYEESLAALERKRAEAAAKLLQSEARLRSAEKDFLRDGQQVQEVQDQLSKCVIAAERSGMVVYGTSNDRDFRGGSSEPIQEGTTVRERQLILTIPDMSEMAVTVKVHESSIKNLQRGQKATIVIDSHANRILNGEVVKVGVLPDSSDRWMNPDIKQYNVQIRIEGTHDWLRPGMSARVEIHVDELKDVLYVPIQAVSAVGSERFCYVAKGASPPERRVVQTGAFNNDFIEITSGLNEGDVVLLNAPDLSGRGKQHPGADDEPAETTEEEAPAAAEAA
jgi:RND family efflux transporter MFP subunit